MSVFSVLTATDIRMVANADGPGEFLLLNFV